MGAHAEVESLTSCARLGVTSLAVGAMARRHISALLFFSYLALIVRLGKHCYTAFCW